MRLLSKGYCASTTENVEEPLYGLDVYVAQSLTEDEFIAFNAGSHTELIKMAYKDFERLVYPKVLSFTTRYDRIANTPARVFA